MNPLRSLALLVLVPATLAACSAFARNTATEPAAPASETSPGLPGQTLQPGECGLFLWTRGPVPQFVFFQRGGEEGALALIGEAPTAIERTGFGGDLFGDFLTRQEFVAPGQNFQITLTVEPGDAMLDGQRVPTGVMRLTGAEGWTVMQPVSGVRACMPVGQ